MHSCVSTDAACGGDVLESRNKPARACEAAFDNHSGHASPMSARAQAHLSVVCGQQGGSLLCLFLAAVDTLCGQLYVRRVWFLPLAV